MAEAYYRVLPKRLEKFGLKVAPEKTRLLRFSRFRPGMQNRFSFLGFQFHWSTDRAGERRVKRRTDRKKQNRAMKDFTDWVKGHRHLPTKELFRQVTWKLRGHYNYFGFPGNSRSLWEYHSQVLATLFKWLRRRNNRRPSRKRRRSHRRRPGCCSRDTRCTGNSRRCHSRRKSGDR